MALRPCADFDQSDLLDHLEQHPKLNENNRVWISRLAANYRGYRGLSDREIQILTDIARRAGVGIDPARWAFPR